MLGLVKMTAGMDTSDAILVNSVKHSFGSYRGFVIHVQARAARCLGLYWRATQLDWSRVTRFTFVCKGNVCRSPYAAVRASQLGFPAISCGLETAGGIPADPVAQKVAQGRGLDLSTHRSTQFSTDLLSAGDLIVAFEPAHYRVLRERVKDTPLSLLGLWAARGARPYIADPYGKCEEYFARCYELIDAGLDTMISNCMQRRRS